MCARCTRVASKLAKIAAGLKAASTPVDEYSMFLGDFVLRLQDRFRFVSCF